MEISPDDLTQLRRFFTEPSSPSQRQYEALRSFYLEGLDAAEAARRFGYTYGSFRVLCHQFRHDLDRRFFRELRPGPTTQPKKNPARELIVAMRKQNLSVGDIKQQLETAGHRLSTTAIWEVLKEEGFARLPRRGDEDRPQQARPISADIVDVREFAHRWPEGRFHSKAAGLFLLLPLLVQLDFDRVVRSARLPGSVFVPSVHALRALLLLKLLGTERTSHVTDLVFDPGLPLLAGLNVMPKTTWFSTYADRIDHKRTLRLLSCWLEAITSANLIDGEDSFNLDFHSVPFFGSDDFVQKHYVAMRSRSQKAVLTFMAHHAASDVFCYSNADIRKGEEADEIIRFIEYWKKERGSYPQHLVFDSKLTTYANLDRLRELGIGFMTLRRRSPKLLTEIANLPRSAWQTVDLDLPQRKFSTPKVFEQDVRLTGYNGALRQFFIKDLGHDEATILLTNETPTAKALITRYAQRMLIENSLSECVGFFHLNALSSSVGLKVDFDVALTVIASGIYRLLAKAIRGYQRAEHRTIFRRFLDTSGQIEVSKTGVTVSLPKRAHNPLLLEAGLIDRVTEIPWWAGRTLSFKLG